MKDLSKAARSIGALADGLRREMYLFIRGHGAPVSREEAARQVGISAKLAAFHLDKLVDEGLLKAHYARRPGRGGPGAGRSSKLYEPADRSVAVSLPPRAYDLIGQLLLRTLETKLAEESPDVAARRVGYECGVELGSSAPRRTSFGKVLSDVGFEPRDEAGRVVLANCPFHALAETNRQLVCGLNHAFVSGVLDGAGEKTKIALLDPGEGRCCVTIEEAAASS